MLNFDGKSSRLDGSVELHTTEWSFHCSFVETLHFQAYIYRIPKIHEFLENLFKNERFWWTLRRIIMNAVSHGSFRREGVFGNTSWIFQRILSHSLNIITKKRRNTFYSESAKWCNRIKFCSFHGFGNSIFPEQKMCLPISWRIRCESN